MFFTPELLSKRDSGFGLLWLAATLGSKSTLKKLPRRSIQTANIPELCDLISHPSEPLALRLSSNLMVGVARVYKIKHEIFLTDVNNCFTVLRKAVQEIHALGALSETQLQMGQPTARPDALTLTVDPVTAAVFNLDVLDANWADFSATFSQGRRATNDDDDEFDPHQRPKRKQKSILNTSLEIPAAEVGRTGLHILDEYHDHLLPTTLDPNASFLSGLDISSSQIDGGFNLESLSFDENRFDHFDLGLGDIGDDLARELGEGWGADDQNLNSNMPMDIDQGVNLDMGGFDIGHEQLLDNNSNIDTNVSGGSISSLKRRRLDAESDKENFPPTFQDRNVEPDLPVRKIKKTRLILDSRIELTDDELKVARERYTEGQREIRDEIERKKLEKQNEKILEDIIWGVPQGLVAPALTKFWTEIINIRVNSKFRDGIVEHLDPPAAKQQKKLQESRDNGATHDYELVDMNVDFDVDYQRDVHALAVFNEDGRIRSSEEPERGRDAITQASLQLAFDADLINPSSGTQRSVFFPWDNAAGSSSTNGFAPLNNNSDRLSLDNADIRLARSRSRSGSLKNSISLVHSQSGSLAGFSSRVSLGAAGDDFRFEVSNNEAVEQINLQENENSTLTLERNSFNFLEYCKMQANSLPGNQNVISFNDVVPQKTSSRRIASAAFHHCLVLATKDLISVHQATAYEPLSIRIK